MSIDDDSTLGNGLEEIELGQHALVLEVKEAHIFEEEGVHAGLAGGLEVDLLDEFGLEAR